MSSSHSGRNTGKRGRYALAAALLVTSAVMTSACSGDFGNATSPPPDANARVATLSLTPLTAPVYAGDTVQLVAVAHDAAGAVVDGVQVSWTLSDSVLASIGSNGALVGHGHGPVRVTASAGVGTTTLDVAVKLTAADRRFAHVAVTDASPSTAYRPADQFNATGGGTVVSRTSTGEYVVTFERLAKVDSSFRETVLVTPLGTAGERCHLQGWANNANGRDLDVSVRCFTFSGVRVDSRFSVLVVGSHSLPSRYGFTLAGEASAQYAPEADRTYSSFSQGVGILRSTVGSYLVQLDGAVDDTPQNYFVSTVGGGDALCKVGSWNRNVWASVSCYAPSGALSDARFSLLMLDGGRPGQRFGFAWANEPAGSLGSEYVPHLLYQRTSSGQSVRVTHVATGTYRVQFPGLQRTGAQSETVQVSPFGGGLFSCEVQGWGNNADNTALDATVRCWNRGTAVPADTYFTILVLE